MTTPSQQHWNSLRCYLSIVTAGAGVTGESPTTTVQRASDGLFLQAGGTTWGVSPADHSMTPVSPLNLPGLYSFSVPSEALTYADAFPGYIFKKVNALPDILEYDIVTTLVRPSSLELAAEGADGDLTLTINDGASPVEASHVRLYNTAGQVVSAGYTDASGQIVFGVPAGNYVARVFKSGYEAAPPVSVVVVENDEVTPQLSGVLPGTATVGSRVAVFGRFFGVSTVEVLFGTLPAVAVTSVNAEGTVALVTVPVGVSGVVPVRVQKPDPNNLPSGKLVSNPVTLVV